MMSDREDTLRRLTAELETTDAVDDAFLAKSFTDRLLILDVAAGSEVPAVVLERLHEVGLREAERVYGEDTDATSFVGEITGGSRHHFVDTRTRGSHQSYIIE
jgi:hypothetical protein